MFQSLEFVRTIVGVGAAGALWIANSVTPEIPGVPAWVTALGLPVAFLVAVIYALRSVFIMLRDSQAGRLADRDAYAAKLEGIHERSDASRDRHTEATNRLVTEIEKLAARMGK